MTYYPTTTTQVPGPVNVVYQREFLEEAYPWCVYFEGSKAATISSNNGSFTAKWRRINNLAANTTALSEVANATNVAFPLRHSVTPTVEDITATVQKYGQFLYVSEEVDLVNYNGYAGELNRALAVAAALSLNQLQRNELEDNLSQLYASSVNGTANVQNAISLNDFARARNWIARNNGMPFTAASGGSGNENTTPIPPCYLAFCHTDVAEDVRGLPGFFAAEKYMSQTKIYRGEIGMLPRVGVRVIESTEASIDTNSGLTTGSTGMRSGGTKVDVYNTVVIGQNCHGSWGLDKSTPSEIFGSKDTPPMVQILTAGGSASIGDPLNELRSIGYKTWHAAKIISKKDGSNVTMWGRNIQSGATSIT